MGSETGNVAALVSGGLDSGVLILELCGGYEKVFPLYIRQGLHWEEAELSWLRKFLMEVRRPHIQPLRVLDLPISDVYREHWSVSGRGVPRSGTPDSAVYLPGRNLLLLAKAAVFCSLNGIHRIALAPLEANPFPDATPEFFRAFGNLSGAALDHSLGILTPFRGLTKVQVIQKGRDLPLHLTFSCINPRDGLHCGSCNKCEERRSAFRSAAVEDRTSYARP